MMARLIKVLGVVQGVGFRPAVWRLAMQLGLTGTVSNHSDGVRICVWGENSALNRFAERLQTEAPPLARIDCIKTEDISSENTPTDFTIVSSTVGTAHAYIAPDTATCDQCVADTMRSRGRRFQYPFTNCTHCGPRFSIINGIPYDRKNSSMVSFKLCNDCQTEYDLPSDRRFHAQPNACPVCGPKLWFELAGRQSRESKSDQRADSKQDAIALAVAQIKQGKIVAIKGIGGFHLACDASNNAAVKRLRARKRRYQKPFAMMAKDIQNIKLYCRVSDVEAALLKSNECPIVVLAKNDKKQLAELVAPNQVNLGFMLPYSPLHHLLMQNLDDAIVLTSGNLSEEPQCIENEEARKKLSDIADAFLLHDRDILNRIDDSVVRLMDSQAVLIRRARGYAPVPIRLPSGFEQAPAILAMGAELKNTFCLIKEGQAIISQHMGDLHDAASFQDYLKNLDLYQTLFDHRAERIAIDRHPDYRASRIGHQMSEQDCLPLDQVQHHHAHIAACMAENSLPLDTESILGIALDGLGFGDEQSFWGGEFLLADYRGYQRVGRLMPVALLGGNQAMLEPWRNTYAHLNLEGQWTQIEQRYQSLQIVQLLKSKPLATLDAMLASDTNSPLASSCGRLFDAVAAAVGICPEKVNYEGQAAIELETAIDLFAFAHEDDSMAYSFTIDEQGSGEPLTINSTSMWMSLLEDLLSNTSTGIISARFHKGLVLGMMKLIRKVCEGQAGRTIKCIALSGGVFQNKALYEYFLTQLRTENFDVLTHRQLPVNDGGISFGQAVVAAARSIEHIKTTEKRS